MPHPAADRRGLARIAAAGPVVSAVSVQTGAGFGATLLPVIGAPGVVGLRQVVAALVLLPACIRAVRSSDRAILVRASLLGLVLVVMNTTIYFAVERIGLGLAVTLEFLGPLAVALFSSRRAWDVVCGVAAGLGVVLLTGVVGGIDVVGVAFALVAGAAWAAYILLGKSLGPRLPGMQSTALASAVASVVSAPFLVVALLALSPTQLPHVLLVGLALGVLSSALPYSLDLTVLRLIPRSLFSVLQSVHPAMAALSGYVILGQTLSVWQIAGLAVISLANAAAVLGSARREAALRRAALSV